MYSYLLINFFTILFPLILSFDKKVYFVQYWSKLVIALVITGLFFLIWDIVFTYYNVWGFADIYIIGWRFYGLPLEEILFFITVPFACMFIYECLNVYVKKDVLRKATTPITYSLFSISLALLAVYQDRVYTLITFSLLLVLSAYLLIRKPNWLGRFYLAYLVSLIPFVIVNGILTAIPIVTYNDLENIGFRWGTIPFEDSFYLLDLLLLNALIFEKLKQRKNVAIKKG